MCWVLPARAVTASGDAMETGWMKCPSMLAVLIAACGGGDEVRVEGAHYQYVVSDLRIASNTETARATGLDLDGDVTVDNQLGQVFGTLQQMGLGVGDTAREALLRGGLIRPPAVMRKRDRRRDAE